MFLGGLIAICVGLLLITAAWVTALTAPIPRVRGRVIDGVGLLVFGLLLVGMSLPPRDGDPTPRRAPAIAQGEVR